MLARGDWPGPPPCDFVGAADRRLRPHETTLFKTGVVFLFPSNLGGCLREAVLPEGQGFACRRRSPVEPRSHAVGQPSDRERNLVKGRPGLGCRPLRAASRREATSADGPEPPDPCAVSSRPGGLGRPVPPSCELGSGPLVPMPFGPCDPVAPDLAWLASRTGAHEGLAVSTAWPESGAQQLDPKLRARVARSNSATDVPRGAR